MMNLSKKHKMFWMILAIIAGAALVLSSVALPLLFAF